METPEPRQRRHPEELSVSHPICSISLRRRQRYGQRERAHVPLRRYSPTPSMRSVRFDHGRTSTPLRTAPSSSRVVEVWSIDLPKKQTYG